MLDKKAPEFDVSNLFYKNIFRKNLALTVVKGGDVGTFVPVPVDCKDNVTTAEHSIRYHRYEAVKFNLSFIYFSNVIDQKCINYIGVNVLDETLLQKEDVKVELGNIDYSGVTNSGQQIMGLSRLDLETYKLVPDPVLSWLVPEEWSLEDAVTIPHAFCGVKT